MNSPRWLKTKSSTQSAWKALKVGKKQGDVALLSFHQIPKDKGSKRYPGQMDEELKQMPKTRGRSQKNNFSLRKPKSEVGNGNRKRERNFVMNLQLAFFESGCRHNVTSVMCNQSIKAVYCHLLACTHHLPPRLLSSSSS
jgi:hypothetical protein